MDSIQMAALAAALIIVAVLLLLFIYYQNKKIVKTSYTMKAETENDFKIVHLSDFHSTVFKKLPDMIRKESPDLIAITGDLINDRGKNTYEMLSFVTELSEIAPIAYVTGNHEHRLNNFDEIMGKIANAGAKVLLNDTAVFKVKDTEINVLGLDEDQGSFEQYKKMIKGTFTHKDYSGQIGELSKKDGFRLLLTHFPENFACIGEKSYSNFDFDLMLAGHAHGGQFNLPFIGPVFSPGQGLFPKYAKGSFGTKPMMIVSRGFGNSEFPFRLFNHPELIVINIKGKQA